ncbi:MAG: LapA family protein [Chroococcales cyanobacterium]
MRQLNFLLMFGVCLALVLFGMENTQPAVIQIIPGVEVQAPLAIELIVTMGVGAILAWMYSVWNRFGRYLEYRKQKQVIREQEAQIESLEEDVERYQSEIEKQRRLSPASETVDVQPVKAPEEAIAQ